MEEILCLARRAFIGGRGVPLEWQTEKTPPGGSEKCVSWLHLRILPCLILATTPLRHLCTTGNCTILYFCQTPERPPEHSCYDMEKVDIRILSRFLDHDVRGE